MKKIPFVFLTHINRTGSTYIASLLDKYEEIDVGIEGIIPDNYIKPMPIINSNEALNQYLAILYSDKRFIDWEIDPERLRAELLKIEFPISFNQILQTLFNIYFKNNTQTSLYVHKSGPYINYYSELKTDFPDSKFIFPVRDPRAVYNSMLNSKTIDGAYMARNPINTVAEIKKNYNLAIKLNHNNDFYIVVYESLINNPDKEINKLLEFLNVKNREIIKTKYFDKIPENQKHLHSLVKDNKPKTERIDAWKDKLGNHEILYIEKNLNNIMDTFGYNKLNPSLNFRDQIMFQYLYFKKFYKSFKRLVKKILVH